MPITIEQQQANDHFNKWWAKQKLPDIAKPWCQQAFVEGGLYGIAKAQECQEEVEKQLKIKYAKQA